ncbi:MAG: hypothetical protein JWL80_99 [Parcubacteria group bacterium]|nr:hypothetical protein [Parcubacteria group bacterium]
MVSIGIMLAITATVLLNQNKYTAGASLKNNANDLSLIVRQAQIYGISVKELSSGSGNFTSAYGVVFDISGTGSATSYIFFADSFAQNNDYDGNFTCPIGGTSECLGKFNLSTNNSINRLCVILSNGSTDCTLKRFAVSFLRPDTDTIFKMYDSAGLGIVYPGSVGVQVELVSTNGALRYVKIYNTGQISVQ